MSDDRPAAGVRLHPHAVLRLAERGATEAEVIDTVLLGARSEARAGRAKFSRWFVSESSRRGRAYRSKLVEAYAVEEDGWLVITVVVKFSQEAMP